jgi:hypothetical protein
LISLQIDWLWFFVE